MMPAAEEQPSTPRDADHSPAPVGLRVDDRPATPSAAGAALDVATSPTPRLSWVVPLVRDGQSQPAYEIRASRGGDPRTGDAWDSGLVESDSNSDVPWGGPPLSAHERLSFVVRTADETGRLSDWSEPGTIETGPLTRADWAAEWITFPTAHAASRDVSVPRDSAVERATLHLAGHAVVRAEIDGVAVNADARDLTDSSLKRATARSYDVTALLSGEASVHRLSLVATIGHYRKVLARPRLIALLRLEYADETVTEVGTDASWTHLPTSLVRDEPFYLEEHDPAVADDWRSPGAVGQPVTVLSEVTPGSEPTPDEAPGLIVPDAGPPVRITRRRDATLLATIDGVRVYDVGENVAGRSRVVLPSSVAGDVVTIVHGEKLDARGRVDTTNIRMPDDVERERQLVVWHCDGSALTIEPWFAVAGFRYLEVRGFTGDDEPPVSVGVLHSDAARTGWLETDVPQLDALVDMALRTQLNNTTGFPSDCPTREQAGWTGDASVSVEAALAHLGLEGMYRNWLADVALDAEPGGGIRGVAPNLLGHEEEQGADPVWGSAVNEIAWQLWWATGDTSTLHELLPAIRRWADWQLGTLEDGVVRHAELSFGADWLALRQTPPVLLQTAAVVVCLRQLADLEEATGDDGAAALRRAQAESVTASARRLLRDPAEGTWGNDSQGSTAVALSSVLAPDDDVAALRARLRAAVAAEGDRLTTGFSATRSAVRALADADGGTALLDAIRQPAQPGIGSMLVDGPGTFWETWWIDDENVGVASLDHIGLGAPYAAWAWTHVAGLRPLTPGFRRFAVQPRLLGQVGRARLRRDTPRGRIEVDWTFADGAFSARITVPVGSTCVLALPGQSPIELPSGHHEVTRAGVAPEPETVAAVPPTGPGRKGETWLSDGATSAWRAEDDSLSVELFDSDTFCTPVYHEPMPAPSLAVTVDDFAPGRDYWIALQHDGALDLTDAAFVFASFDVDGGGLVGRAVRPLVRLTAADGDTRVGTVRPLPIAWNRVAVDIGDWPGRSAVAKVEVGISWSDEHDTARGPYLALPETRAPFPFRVGRVGWTSAPRTY